MANVEAIKEQVSHWAEQPVAEILPLFTDIVGRTEEEERQQEHHETVDSIFRIVVFDATQPKTLDQILLINAQSDRERDDVRVHYAGIGRIQYVDANSQIKDPQQPREEKQTIVQRRIEPVRQLYERIDVSTLPPRTAQGGEIHWLGEITGDRLKTLERLGDKQEAQEGLEKAISDIRRELAEIAEAQTASEKEQYETADLSLLGVLQNQHGRLTKNQPEVVEALQTTRQAHARQKNTHRLATISIHTVATSLLPHHQGTLKSRIIGVALGSLSYLQALREDRKQSINALTHARAKLKEQ